MNHKSCFFVFSLFVSSLFAFSLCIFFFTLLFLLPCPQATAAESTTVSPAGVVLSDGYGGPLPSSLQISQLGTLIAKHSNHDHTLLAMILQELAKKSLDTEALLKGIGEYFSGLEGLLKELEQTQATQGIAYAQKEDEVFGKTPFHCSDTLTAHAMRAGKKAMRAFATAMKTQRIAQGEGTQTTEMRAEASVAAMLFRIMAENMTEGHPNEQRVPSGASLFPFSGVLNAEGSKIYQAIIHAVNSEPSPTIKNPRSLSGRRALELQGIKMGRVAGIQEGLQVAFDLQNPVINGQAFSQMQAEVNASVRGEALSSDNFIEGAHGDTSGGISVLQAITHQFERSRLANPDWYAQIDNGGMNEKGLLRELIKLTAWRGYTESQQLRIQMINAYNLAQLTAILMERHDNARLVSVVYPPGESPTKQAD